MSFDLPYWIWLHGESEGGYYIQCIEKWSNSTKSSGGDGDGGNGDGGDGDAGDGDGSEAADGGNGGDGGGNDANGSDLKTGGDKRVYSMKNISHSVTVFHRWWYMVTHQSHTHDDANIW